MKIVRRDRRAAAGRGGLLVLSAVLVRFKIDSPATAIALAAIVGLLNGLVWPVLARFTLPLSVLTLGLGSLVLNAGLFALAASAAPGVQIGGWPEAIVVVVALTILTSALSALLAVDDDESWHRNVVRRQARRRGDRVESDVPGVVFLEIDGLGHEVLRRALRDGNAPTLARWLRDGSHDLERWETDWSSQTGPARPAAARRQPRHPRVPLVEKDLGRAIVTNHPRDAEEIERRHSDGHGLLHAGGASRANIVSGDAVHSLLTMSTVLRAPASAATTPPTSPSPTPWSARSCSPSWTSPASAQPCGGSSRTTCSPASTADGPMRWYVPGRRSSSATSRSRR